MQRPLAQTSIEHVLRSTLSDHPDCLMAFDLAVRDLTFSNGPYPVSPAMKAEAAAAILEIVASAQLDVATLAQHAVHRVRSTSFPPHPVV